MLTPTIFQKCRLMEKMAFNGYVKGIYNGRKEILPAFKVSLDVDQGSFKYPNLPSGFNNITAKVNCRKSKFKPG